MFISISFLSKIFLICLAELVILEFIKSLREFNWPEFPTWGLIFKLKLGPLIKLKSFSVSILTGNFTWYNKGSDISSITHNVDFKSNSWGKGSYNLIKIVGSSVPSSSILTLLAITVLLEPKFK